MGHRDEYIKTGTVLAGTYRVTQLVDGGGIGEIYRAESLKGATQRLAIKVFGPVANNQKYAHRRFEEEVELVAALDHPHIAKVYTVGITADGMPYLVMDYLEGHDLAISLNRMDKIPVKRVGEIMTQLGGALRQAHSQGIIHRDIRPGNVIVCMADQRKTAAKLVNFGTSRLRWSGAEPREILAGHPDPDFVPPELVTGRVVDLGPAADVFSLAATAYYALCGMLPFGGKPLPDSGARPVATPVHEHVPALSPRVSEVLARGMANRPVDRYPRISEFVARLVTALSSRADDVLQWPDEVRAPSPSPAANDTANSGGLQEVATAAVPQEVQDSLLAKQRQNGGLQEVATAAVPQEVQDSLLAKQRQDEGGLQELSTAAVSPELQERLLGRKNEGGGLHEVPTVTLEEKVMSALIGGDDDESGAGWSDELSAALLGGQEVLKDVQGAGEDSEPNLDSGTLEAAWEREPEEDPTADELIFGGTAAEPAPAGLAALKKPTVDATEFDDDDPTVLDRNPPQGRGMAAVDEDDDSSDPDAAVPGTLEVVETGEAAVGLAAEVMDLADWDEPKPAPEPAPDAEVSSKREVSEPHAQLVVSSEVSDAQPADTPGLVKTTSGELKTDETLSQIREAVAEADQPKVQIIDPDPGAAMLPKDPLEVSQDISLNDLLDASADPESPTSSDPVASERATRDRTTAKAHPVANPASSWRYIMLLGGGLLLLGALAALALLTR